MRMIMIIGTGNLKFTILPLNNVLTASKVDSTVRSEKHYVLAGTRDDCTRSIIEGITGHSRLDLALVRDSSILILSFQYAATLHTLLVDYESTCVFLALQALLTFVTKQIV